jgi:hypothetical protein
MDWVRLLVATVASSIATWFFSVQKAARDADIKLAALEARVKAAEDATALAQRVCRESLDSYKAEMRSVMTQVVADMKEASRELHTAVANVQALSQSQAVVNTMNAKVLDSLVNKVEQNTEGIVAVRSSLCAVMRDMHNGNHD